MVFLIISRLVNFRCPIVSLSLGVISLSLSRSLALSLNRPSPVRLSIVSRRVGH